MNVSKWIAGAVIGVVAATFALDAEAQRRLGGGKTFGKQSSQVQQRQATPPAQQTPPQAAPAQQPGTAAAPTAAAGTTAAAGAAAKTASPMRNLLIGAAAGLGLMALASWLGFGETLATIMLFVLLGLVLMMVVGYVMRRAAANRGPQPAYQGAGGGVFGNPQPQQVPQQTPQPIQRSSAEPSSGIRPGSAMDDFLRGGAVNPAQPWGVPAGFDTEGFLANAKGYYAKLQGAWDSGNLEQLQEFTTNEMFIALTHELRGRGGATKTEVVSIDATLLGIETLAAEHIASVRFTGTVKVDGEGESVDEVWNLSKPVDGKHGWLLAGIQQIS
jgi:predicted lipid-binding transport protein (Tim44 family)